MPMEEYSRFELRHVRLVDVELTYLFKLKTAKAVQVALDMLKARATALYGKKAKVSTVREGVTRCASKRRAASSRSISKTSKRSPRHCV